MKIVIVATYGPSLINLRGKLIIEWVKRGHDVVCISIEDPNEMSDSITALGAKYYQVKGTRTGTGIVSSLRMVNDYIKAFKILKPDLCFLYMGKPVAFGGLAAIKCKVKRIIVFVTGLEIAFYSPGFKNILIRDLLKVLFKKVHKHCETVFFMSRSDREKMIKWKLVRKEQTEYVDGSGVDMEWFKKKPMPREPVIAMISRLVWSKGIREYLEAAEIVKKKHPHARFLLAGGLDENPEALTRRELEALIKKNIIEYCGELNDVRPILESCSIFTLPSYHEGKGKSILEAEAVGRPIITTDAPGCSETIIDGYNGFLVPPRDSKALAEKICVLIENVELREKMGENSYNLCCKTFDVNIINKVFLDRMGMN